jgi:uncharacterized membrane protein
LRITRQIPWFLIASILISLAALALANLLAPPLKEAGSYLALALVVLIPGYLAVLFLFPSGGDLDLSRRLLLSLGASVLFAGLISLILYLTPRGLQPASLSTILSLLILPLAAVSYLRWRALPRSRRFIIGARRGYRSRRPAGGILSGLIPRRSRFPIALAAILILAGLSLAIYHYHPGLSLVSSQERYTLLEVSWPESEIAGSLQGQEERDGQYSTITAGRELEARARIENHEGAPANYSLRLLFGNSTIFVKGLHLADNESWDSMLGFVLEGEPGRKELALLLFKDTESTRPYKSEHILIDLIDDQPINQDSVESSINESTEDSTGLPVSFEERTKVTVLSAGGGGSSASQVSESAPTSSTKPPSKSIKKVRGKEETEREVAKEEVTEEEVTEKEVTERVETEKQQVKETAELLPPADDALQAAEPEMTGAPIASGSSEARTRSEAGPDPASAAVSSDNPPSLSVPAPATDGKASPMLVASPAADQPAQDDLISAQPAQDDLISVRQAEEDAISNRPPILYSLLPDRPSPQRQGASIIWRAEAEDPDGDRILYRFLLNGTEKRKWSRSSSWSWPTRYLEAGEYTITVQVMDGLHSPSDSYDSSLDATMTILEQNQPPILKDLEADPKSPRSQGSLITWTARAIDPEQDELSYRFLLDGREVSGWSPSDSWIWNSSGIAAGDHEITVQIIDGSHASQGSFDGELSRPYTLMESKMLSGTESAAESSAAPPESSVEEASKSAGALATQSSIASLNQIPVLTGLEPDAISPMKMGAIVNWTAHATDPGGDQLCYKFLLDDQDVTGWSSSPLWSWNTSDAHPGSHKITVQVRDGSCTQEGSFDASMDAAFTLEEINQPPILLSLEPDLPSPQVQGEIITWKAEATDPDNDPVFYKFQLGGKDMVRWSESNSWSWSTRGLAAGDYLITVLVRDGHHESEYSFDSSLERSFRLNTAIDQQIEELMLQRSSKATDNADFRSSDIRVVVADPEV